MPLGDSSVVRIITLVNRIVYIPLDSCSNHYTPAAAAPCSDQKDPVGKLHPAQSEKVFIILSVRR